MQEISAPRGFVSGTGFITRVDGTKVPFELRSEGPVSLEQAQAAAQANGIPLKIEGEG